MAFINFKKDKEFVPDPIVQEIKEAVKPEVFDSTNELTENPMENVSNNYRITPQQALDLAKFYFGKAEYYNKLGNNILQELETNG